MYNGFYSKITDNICIWHEWAICCSTNVQYVTPFVNIILNWGVLCVVYMACLRQPIKTNFCFSRYRYCCFFFYIYSVLPIILIFVFGIESNMYGNARRKQKQNKNIISKKWFALVHLKWMILIRLAVSLQSIFIQFF